VQIADPIEEEKVKRAVVEIRDLQLGSAITDIGGGGLSSAVGETAERFNCGVLVDLSKVPLKYQNIVPWEIYLSESQERMLLVIPPENLEKVMAVFEKEDVIATAIGTLIPERRLRLKYKDETVSDIEMEFMFNPCQSSKVAIIKNNIFEEPEFSEPTDLTEILIRLLSAPNIASKESVIRTYDHEVKGNTLLKPLQGDYAGPNDAAVVKPLDDSFKGLTISCGMNPNYGKIDAYWMAASAIDEAIRNNIAVGGRRISLLDNFTWGNPEKPERLGSLVRACEACYDFAIAFKAPFISGKDSLYNESPMGPVTPTLLITGIGVIPNIQNTVSVDLKTMGNYIYIVGETFNELGGSEYYKLKGRLGASVPRVRGAKAKRTFKAVTAAIDRGLIKSCHDISEGGLAVAAAEMAFAGGLGLEIELKKVPGKELTRNDFVLFSESNSRFIVEVTEADKEEFEVLMRGKVCALIGKVTKEQKIIIKGLNGEVVVNASLETLRNSWKKTFSPEEATS
jgi:phosphoribosylformylglycinamidine synthase II